MKKLEIKKTKPTFIISTFRTDIIKVGLVFPISNFFIAKTSLANNWRSFSSSYLALSVILRTFSSFHNLASQKFSNSSRNNSLKFWVTLQQDGISESYIFILSVHCFHKSTKTGCMNAPSEHQNNLDVLFIDLGLKPTRLTDNCLTTD